jgi:apolipoprotein N-acyltransferase
MRTRCLGWPGLRAVQGPFLAGAAMALGQAPLSLWWVTLPALALLFHLVGRQQTMAAATWAALFGGAGYFAVALNWIIEPFLVDPSRHGWMAPFAIVLLSFGLALFWAAAAAIAHRLPHRAIAFAATLTLAELARGYVLTGFPWALIGHVWVGTAPAQVAALIGPTGLTLMTTLIAAMLALRRPVPLVVAAVIGLLAFGFGTWRLDQPLPASRGVTVRLVQPNATQTLKWDPDQARIFFERQLSYTATFPPPDLVIWPETAVPYLMDRSPEVAVLMSQAAGGVPVAAGIQRVEGTRGWNSLVVIGEGGKIEGSYDKHHLVPFGEYIPFGDLAYNWFGIAAFAAQQGYAYTAGPGPRTLDLGPRLGRVLPLICYEAVFPQDLLAAPERADWILQITNDAWFGELTGPYQHLAQAQLRAIEQGLPLVRVANTGISAVIDAHGRITTRLPLGVADFVDADLPGALAAPPYARLGEVPVLLLLAGLLAGLLASRWKKAP